MNCPTCFKYDVYDSELKVVGYFDGYLIYHCVACDSTFKKRSECDDLN